MPSPFYYDVQSGSLTLIRWWGVGAASVFNRRLNTNEILMGDTFMKFLIWPGGYMLGWVNCYKLKDQE